MASVNIRFTKLYINNEFVDSLSGNTFPTQNPATGQKIADVSEADKADVDLAVKAAKAAFTRGSEWRNMDASARAKLINKLADLIERDAKSLAALETSDNGKPLEAAILEILGSADVLRYYAGFCDKIHGNTIPSDGNQFALTRKEPIGVVGQIIPWNYPIPMAIWKWGPALAAGCTIVLKPAEQTPLTALELAALSKEAGFPKGVINVLNGFGETCGAALAMHNDVRKICFTGSTEIGHKIMEYSAKSNLKSVNLELGGKSPLVIFDDANLDEAVEIAYNAIFSNQGQNCCAGSRTFVQTAIYDEFVRRAAEKARARKVGDPLKSGTQQGPQVDKPSLDKILRLVESGIKEGAKLEAGGKQVGNVGYFVEPTVFSNVKDDMSIAKEEIFGPVQCILKFNTMEEVIERANNTQYGLASGVITNNINNAMVFAQAVEAGSVWINCYAPISPQTPFGGFKMSGLGRDLGADSLSGYLETKTISIKLPCKN
ncbi:unnamed protein product [Brassicogethes aeneus]|uniref:Aldehyde dehydrogenase domain-containing protein n=1 Tax=Brassicogethes aeneus TaxID=1431903 RepID=A0A9P0B139_BRAAE|nr:unnamed protein product [Brassicogethes aeneus]